MFIISLEAGQWARTMGQLFVINNNYLSLAERIVHIYSMKLASKVVETFKNTFCI